MNWFWLIFSIVTTVLIGLGIINYLPGWLISILEYAYPDVIFRKKLENSSSYYNLGSTTRLNESLPRWIRHNIVALSFNESPNIFSTYEIIKILTRYQIKATFFVSGEYVRMYDTQLNIIRDIVSYSNELGNNGWEIDRKAIMLNSDQLKSSVDRTDSLISKIMLSYNPKLYRPRGFFVTTKMVQLCQMLGYRVILYNHHINSTSIDLNVRKILLKVKSGDIIALQDMPKTVTILESLLPGLISRGYKITTVSDLLTY